MKMKIFLSCAFLFALTQFAVAQPGPAVGERVRSMHAAYITDRLRLTPEESQAFWPIYNEYKDRERELRQANKPPRQVEDLSEEEAAALIDRHLIMEQELLNLKKAYFNRLRSVIPARKLALLNVAEREFKERLINEMQNRRQDRQRPQRGRQPGN